MYKYILLGVIQGLTEFFPVSSSGHLVIFQNILSVTKNQVALDVVLHLGTVCALLVFFFKDIIKLLRDIKMIALIIIVTIITGAIGVAGKDFFEQLFVSPKAVGVSLFITGVILLLTKKFSQQNRDKVSLKDSAILGVTQGIAIIPGISRSGMTISTLLFRGLKSEICFKFSFLVAIPVILGAAVMEGRHISSAMKGDGTNFAAGFIFSFIFGLIALAIVRRVLNKAKLYYFGYYCIIVAILTLIFVKG